MWCRKICTICRTGQHNVVLWGKWTEARVASRSLFPQSSLKTQRLYSHAAPMQCRPNDSGRNCLFSSQLPRLSHMPNRSLWGWLNSIFNRVDDSRIKEVGPDKACAEWLLRSGALVKWSNMDSWTKEYNNIPLTGGRLLKIEEVDATDSAVMHIGFPHFRGCKHIRRIVFHKASYLDDTGLEQLAVLKDSLQELQVSSCGNITADGLRQLKKLKNLKKLLIYDLPEIANKEAILEELQAALPECAVVFPYSQAKDDPNREETKS